MKKYSSLHKIQIANIISIAIFTIALGIEISKYGFDFIRVLNIFNFFLAWMIFINVKKLQKDVTNIAKILKDAKNGVLSNKIDVKDEGEVKEMFENLSSFIEQIKMFLSEAKDIISNASNGEFDRKIEVEKYSGIFKDSAQAIKKSIQVLENNSIYIGFSQLNTKLGELGGGIVRSLKIINEDLQKSKDKVKNIVKVSSKTAKDAEYSKKEIDKIVFNLESVLDLIEDSGNTIQNLAKKIESVNNIITLIKDIAEQTNLLALNAAIEAARAGEHGKGFSVVAEEVRNLSVRTHKAANEVTKGLNELQKESIDSVNKTKTTIEFAKKSTEAINNFKLKIDEFNQNAQNTEKIANVVDNVIDITKNKLDHIILKNRAYRSVFKLKVDDNIGDYKNCSFSKWLEENKDKKIKDKDILNRLQENHKLLHNQIKAVINIIEDAKNKNSITKREKEIIEKFKKIEEISEGMFNSLDNIIKDASTKGHL